MLMRPWLPAPGLTMIAGWRGVGKTFTAAGVALSVASGRPFLGWKVPEPARVLYVDGEMDPVEMRDERLHRMRGALNEQERTQVRENLFLLSHAAFPDTGIPNLSDPDKHTGRRLIEAEAKERSAALIVLDNLSSLCHSGVENEAESWQSMQQWLMSLRRSGYSVLMIHHGGKPNEKGRSKQRGTSKREDVLNTSVMLHRLTGMGPDEFEWEFTKNRGFRPDDPFGVTIGDDGWVKRGGQSDRDALIVSLDADRISQRKIADQVGCSVGTVNSVLKRAKAEAPAGVA
jgi:putative DNA primase/helicase